MIGRLIRIIESGNYQTRDKVLTRNISYKKLEKNDVGVVLTKRNANTCAVYDILVNEDIFILRNKYFEVIQ